MRRGEVWTVADEHGQHRVVVLSGDEYNVMGVAYCAPIMQRSAPMQPYTVALVDPDPIAGTVLVGLTEPIAIGTGTESIRHRHWGDDGPSRRRRPGPVRCLTSRDHQYLGAY